MTDLVVVGFYGDRMRASAALDELRRLDVQHVIGLERAAALYRDADGSLHTMEAETRAAEQHVGWGGLWGALLGAALAVPLTAGASIATAAVVATGAASGAALGATAGAVTAPAWHVDFGMDNAFIRDLAATVQPGDSAIAALLETSNSDAVLEHFKGFGGTVVRTSLTPAQRERLQHYLDDARS